MVLIPVHIERNFLHIGPLSGEALDLVLLVRNSLVFSVTFSRLRIPSGTPLFLPSGSWGRWNARERGSRCPAQFFRNFGGQGFREWEGE